VTGGATGQALDFIFFHQPAAQLFLLDRRFVTHRKYFLPRTHILLRMAVTIEAPLHLQRGFLPGKRHLVDAAMAGFAAHALIDVNAVIEIGEVRQIVHAGPGDGTVCAKAVPHRLQRGARAPDLRVAIHARFGRRNIGEARCLDGCVAVAAVEPHVADVMGVTEGNGLLPRDSGLRGPGRTAPRAEKPQQESQDEHRSEDARLREGVRAAMKNLGHTTALLPAVTGASVGLQLSSQNCL